MNSLAFHSYVELIIELVEMLGVGGRGMERLAQCTEPVLPKPVQGPCVDTTTIIPS